MKRQKNSEGSLEDLQSRHDREELECQRSAPKALLNSVLSVNLVDPLPPATTIASTMRNWNVNGLLGSTLL